MNLAPKLLVAIENFNTKRLEEWCANLTLARRDFARSIFSPGTSTLGSITSRCSGNESRTRGSGGNRAYSDAGKLFSRASFYYGVIPFLSVILNNYSMSVRWI